jgi:hypothetical protein
VCACVCVEGGGMGEGRVKRVGVKCIAQLLFVALGSLQKQG